MGDNFEPEFFHEDDDYPPQPPPVEPTTQNVSERPAPKDKFNFVYCVFYLLGTSILLPWFFFVTCNDYWMYRFRDLKNHTNSLRLMFGNSDAAENRTQLQADFTAYISLASSLPSTLFLIFNVFYLRKCSIHWRVLGSSVSVLLLFVVTTILVLIDSDPWQLTFFIVTVGTVVFLNMSTAMLQAALCGIIMKFPVSYLSAFSSGQSLSGIFASIALIVTLCVNTSPTQSTFLYFTFADMTIMASFLGYLAIKQTSFFNYYAYDFKETSGSIQYRRLGSEASISSDSVDYLTVQKKIWIPSVSLFFCYIVTASIYPAIAVLVVSEYTGVPSAWNEKYFVPVITYLLYCCCEYTGRLLAGIIQRPKGVLLVWFSVLRFLFIPLLMFCNAQPRHHLPVLINSDWIYTAIIITLALSNGYLANMTFILLPGCVLNHEQEVSSTMLVTWLGASLSIGSMLSFPLINML